MKTIKTFVRDLLRIKSNSYNNAIKEKRNEDETENQFNNQQNDSDERETDEIPRDPELDNPAAQETHRPAEKRQPMSGEPGEGTGESGEREPGNVITREMFDKAVKEAFLKGEITGRNAAIAEKYFPDTDDGIPSFHGALPKALSESNFFSIAREA